MQTLRSSSELVISTMKRARVFRAQLGKRKSWCVLYWGVVCRLPRGCGMQSAIAHAMMLTRRGSPCGKHMHRQGAEGLQLSLNLGISDKEGAD